MDTVYTAIISLTVTLLAACGYMSGVCRNGGGGAEVVTYLCIILILCMHMYICIDVICFLLVYELYTTGAHVRKDALSGPSLMYLRPHHQSDGVRHYSDWCDKPL